MTDVTAATIGLTTPMGDLIHQIQTKGFEVTKVQWSNKDKAYVAEGKNSHGEKLSKTGPSEQMALGNLLLAVVRHVHMRSAAIRHKIGAWHTTFTNKMEEIAKAYAQAKSWDANAAAAFKALADDSVHRAAVLGQQLHVEVVDDPHPYETVGALIKDIYDNRHMFVSRANPEHPIWSIEQVIAFRTVHNAMGHAVSGGGWDWEGENLACASHFPLLNPIAQQALFTEALAKNAYNTFYPGHGGQKVALFPEIFDLAQREHNPLGHGGLHPSQTEVPGNAVVAKTHEAQPGEFHSSLKVPSEILGKIENLVEDIDMEMEDPSEYHMTWLFLKDVDKDARAGLEGKHAEGNIEQSGEFKFTNARLDTFPGRDGETKSTVVIRFDSPEACKRHDIWEKTNEDEYGLDPGPFAGAYKPHITVGWTEGEVPKKKLEGLDFTSEGFEVSPGHGETKTSMAADPYWLDNWIQRNGPYLYHSTQSPDQIPSVLEKGLIPWDHPDNPSGSSHGGGWLEPRPGHVYLRPKVPTRVQGHTVQVGHPKQASDSTAPQTRMQQLRAKYPEMSTQEIWAQERE